jgi:hypothetical protein
MHRVLYASAIAAALFAVQIPGAAKASTLIYNLTLTALVGSESGTGSVTITVPPVGSNGFLTQGNGLTAMDFKIDGLDFSLNNSSEVMYFYQGSNLVLASIGYYGKIGTDQLFSFSLGSLGAYSFSGIGDNTFGSISVSSTPVSSTPLPAALTLFATGLGALGLLGWRRKRKASAAIAAA